MNEFLKQQEQKNNERREEIQHAVNIAKARLQSLKNLQASGFLSKAGRYEMEMTLDCIQRGEKILGIKQ